MVKEEARPLVQRRVARRRRANWTAVVDPKQNFERSAFDHALAAQGIVNDKSILGEQLQDFPMVNRLRAQVPVQHPPATGRG